MHAGSNLLGCGFQIAYAVATHSYFYWVSGVVVIHLLEAYVAVGEVVGVAVGITVEHIFGSIIIHSIHDELRKVGTAYLRSIGGMETGRTLTYKCGYCCHLRVVLLDVVHLISHLCRLLCGSSIGKIELHGKLVSFGNRHHSLRKLYEDNGSYAHQGNTHDKSGARKGETTFQQPSIARHQKDERLLKSEGQRLAAYALMNHHILHIRR